MFWVISVYFNIRNTLPKSGTSLLGHPVYECEACSESTLYHVDHKINTADLKNMQICDNFVVFNLLLKYVPLKQERQCICICDAANALM